MQRKIDEPAVEEEQPTPSAAAPEKKGEEAQEVPTEEEEEPYLPSRPLIETLSVRLATYDGDRYLFSLGVTSEFDKRADYDRGTFHDAQFEYLLEKAMELRDKLDSSALYARAPEVPTGEKEAGEWGHLDRGGQLYARILERGDELIVLPVESLGIKVDDKVITNFLEPRVLQKLKEKRGIDYRIEAKNGLLRAIVVKGAMDKDAKEKLLSPIGWSLEKASGRGAEPEPKVEEGEGDTEIERVKALFSGDLLDLLSFERAESFVLVKPRKFLGSEIFAKIAAIVREAKGEYISAGKQSHFRVPLER